MTPQWVERKPTEAQDEPVQTIIRFDEVLSHIAWGCVIASICSCSAGKYGLAENGVVPCSDTHLPTVLACPDSSFKARGSLTDYVEPKDLHQDLLATLGEQMSDGIAFERDAAKRLNDLIVTAETRLKKGSLETQIHRADYALAARALVQALEQRCSHQTDCKIDAKTMNEALASSCPLYPFC